MPRLERSTVRTALVALVAAFVVVVALPGTARAAPPPVCADSATNSNVYLWVGGGASAKSWDDDANWSHTVGGVAQSGAPLDDSTAIVCILGSDTISTDASGPHQFIYLDQLHLDGSTVLEVVEGTGVFVNGTDPSVWGPDTRVDVTRSELGGTGTIIGQGLVTFTSGEFAGTFLTTVHNGGGMRPPASPGTLVVEGKAQLQDLGLALEAGYHVEVVGTASLAPNAWFAADYGTSLSIQAGGVLDFTGDAAYDQGFAVADFGLSTLINKGTLVKSGGTGTSVVDANYLQGATGQVLVQSGTIALPDDQQVSAEVSPGQALATGTCDGSAGATGSVCQPTTDPAEDVMNVELAVPSTNGVPAEVQLQELPPVDPAVDAQRVGNEVLAHADNLAVDAAHPATILLRFSQADVMATPLDEVQVVHTDDSGLQTQIPGCVGAALPAGVSSCVVRPVTRTGQNTFVTVLTTQTSRWHLRRNKTIVDPKVPSPPQGLVAQRASPFDGSVVRVAWTAPAANGGAAVTSYDVYRDGVRVAATTGTTSLLVKGSGPGGHVFAVAAVNSVGEGPRAVVAITLAALSRPRKVLGLLGARDGKLSAGTRWKAPAQSGGLTIRGYQVLVDRRGDGKVDRHQVGAAKRKLLVTLTKGSYRFKVRARNGDGYGPWSVWTDWLSPR